MRSFFREIVTTLLLAVAIFLLLHATMQPFIIRYSCMEPGLYEGQRLLINKVGYFFQQPKRGDVVVFDPPFPSDGPFIKRIIGLPGESVEIKQGKVYIYRSENVLVLDEPYLKEPPIYTFGKRQIPKDEYFVLGDNRNNSNDSHNGWTMKRQNIIGKAWLSIWPPGKWGVVTNPLS